MNDLGYNATPWERAASGGRPLGDGWPRPLYWLACILLITAAPLIAPFALVWWVVEWIVTEIRSQRERAAR